MEVVRISLLTRNVNDAHLREIFSRYGEVKDVRIVRDNKTGYVKYDNSECAAKAARCMNGGQIDGVVVRVQPEEAYPGDYSSNFNSFYTFEKSYVAIYC